MDVDFKKIVDQLDESMFKRKINTIELKLRTEKERKDWNKRKDRECQNHTKKSDRKKEKEKQR